MPLSVFSTILISGYEKVRDCLATKVRVIGTDCISIGAAAKHLPPSDVWCILCPSLKYFLRYDIKDVDETSLRMALKPRVRLNCHQTTSRSHILHNFPGKYLKQLYSGR